MLEGLRRGLGDHDLWWHLKVGEWIVAQRAVPWTDPFAANGTGGPWIAYSWLAEVLFHAVTEALGFGALVYLRTMLATAVVWFLYCGARAAGAPRLTYAIRLFISSPWNCGQWPSSRVTGSIMELA